MKKYIPAWVAVLLASAMILTGGFLATPDAGAETATERSSSLELFLDVYSMTRSTYVDSVESVELVESAIRGMLRSLDPNSVLLTPAEYENLQIQLQGSFEGVGITIGQREGWLTVISPLEGTPASRAGMRGGDRIVLVDGEPTEDMSTNEAVSHIRGPEGTTVDLTVIRPGVRDSLEFEIVRGVIDYPSVSASFMLDDSIGYVRLSRFSRESASDVYQAIDTLREVGASNLILDLRGNSGGLFAPAVDVADIFLPSGSMVVTTRGKAVGETSYFTERRTMYDGRLVVLVDRGSASSAEIVAGALKDNEAATVIGTRTFGKGSVQNLTDMGVYPGLGRYGVKLTTARYYTPRGHSIDRTLRDDFMDPDAERTWGIEPDLEVQPAEFDSRFVSELEREAMFFRFATEFTLEHEVPDGFWPDTEVIEEFRDFLSEEDFYFDEDHFAASLPYLERALLREIAFRVWNMDTYYRAIAPHDEHIQAALECLRAEDRG
ncbi:PDZ domain-containing protein [Candidatus Fermentibacteria bacterium]|nr:PDZ domain-containing protein [Candidatus Fermentibacteria bacterium]